MGGPPLMELHPPTLLTCLSERLTGTHPGGSIGGSSPEGLTSETLPGEFAGATDSVTLRHLCPVGPMTVTPAADPADGDREPHSHNTHLNAAALLRGALHFGGSVFETSPGASSCTTSSVTPAPLVLPCPPPTLQTATVSHTPTIPTLTRQHCYGERSMLGGLIQPKAVWPITQ